MSSSDETVPQKPTLIQQYQNSQKLTKSKIEIIIEDDKQKHDISSESGKSTSSSSDNNSSSSATIKNQERDISKIIYYMISNFLLNNKKVTESSQDSQEEDTNQSPSQFYTQKQPEISLQNYFKRIQIQTKCNNSIMILGFIYFDKIVSSKALNLSKINWHKLIFVSILTAIRYKSKTINQNSFYAKVGGLSVEKMHKAELEFMRLLKFNLKIEQSLFQKTIENCQFLYDKLFEDEENVNNESSFMVMKNINKKIYKRQFSNFI